MELSGSGGDPLHRTKVLLFFAVPEEARPFLRRWLTVTHQRAVKSTRAATPGLARYELDGLIVHVTGMGRRRAARVGAAAFAETAVRCSVTAGFAGGLDPALRNAEVRFEADAGFPGLLAVSRAGAKPGRFHEATRIAVTAAHKAALWRETGADAVEMESSTLRALARERGVPSATVRVISDTAHQTLPLDFNALMTPDERLDFVKLALALVRSPRIIPRLITFRKTVNAAAEELARVLVQWLAGPAE